MPITFLSIFLTIEECLRQKHNKMSRKHQMSKYISGSVLFGSQQEVEMQGLMGL